jgi:hypothetical protein
MSPVIQKALIHFGKLVLLGGAGALVVGVLAFLSGFNIATLPVTYQLIAGILVPMAIEALNRAKDEIAAELAAEQAAKDLAVSQAQTAKAIGVAKALGAQPKDLII